MDNRLKTAQKGFTIIELLIVIAIVGILAGLMLNKIQDSRAKARDTHRKTDLNNMHSILENYHNNNKNYPTVMNTTILNGIQEASLKDTEDVIVKASGITADVAPTEPYTSVKPANNESQYSYTGYNCTGTTETDTCSKFILYSWLERGGLPYSSYTKNSLN